MSRRLSPAPIPVDAARKVAVDYGYDQVVIIARRVGEGGKEHVTTYGLGDAHAKTAADIGNFIKHKIMGWPVPAEGPAVPAPKKPAARSTADMDEQLTMVEDCEARESRMTDWERGFIDSLKTRLCAGGPLSEEQARKLDEVWERVCSKGTRL